MTPFLIVIIWTMASPKAPSLVQVLSKCIISIGRIIRMHNISYHMYADDIQLFLDFKPSDPTFIETALSRLSACICEIKVWMTKNMLKLNDSKTEFFVAISPYNKRKLSLDVQLRLVPRSLNHLRLYVT